MKHVYILFFALASFCMQAQSAKKNMTATFEYVSAEYTGENELLSIQCKDEKGEIYFFEVSAADKIKNGDLLYNETSGSTAASRIVTKTELVGKKLQLIYEPIGYIDPASPYCCYRISSVMPL